MLWPLRTVMLGTFLYLCAIRFAGIMATLVGNTGRLSLPRGALAPPDARALDAMLLILELSVVWFGVRSS